MAIQPYKTSDQFFATYLLYLGFYAPTAVPGRGKRLDWLFVDVPNPQELEREFFSDAPQPIKPYSFLKAYKTSFSILNKAMTPEEIETIRENTQ